MASLENVWHDVRHGCRHFAKSPGFAAIAVISIAFGTGGNVAMFSVADALLLRPLPVARPTELLTVGSQVKRLFATLSVASYSDYVDIRERSRSFDGLLASTNRSLGVGVRPGVPPHVRLVTLVSANYFGVLGVVPEIGRGFLSEEDHVEGRDAVVVLSYGLWQAEFAGDPGVLGRKLRIGGIEFTVIGVTPERFTGIEPRLIPEGAFVPLAMWPRLLTGSPVNPLRARDLRVLTLKGRLRDGVTLDQARGELAGIAQDLSRRYPETNRGIGLVAQTEVEYKVAISPLESGFIVILTVLSMAVLSVACANVAGLLASRAPVRAREIAMRLAIGAGRARIVRQLMTESLLIALAGGLGGAVVGYVGILVLRQVRFPTDVIAVPTMQLDDRALTFSLVLAMASAFVFGVGPAIQTVRVDLATALKVSDAGAARRQRVTGRNVLVALQVALSLVVLTIAAFAFRTFNRELNDGPGFRTTQMAKVGIDPTQAGYNGTRSVQFFERVADGARVLPGVRSVGLATVMPLFGFDQAAIAPEGFQLPDGQRAVSVNANSVDEGYFGTMEIPILSGRDFLATDSADAPRVAIVNDTFVRRYWIGESAVGKRFRMRNESGPSVEVVGVVRTTNYLFPAETPQEMLYFPFRQVPPRTSMVVLAGTMSDSASGLTPLGALLHGMDPDVPVFDLQTIEVFYEARVTSIGSVVTRLVAGIGLMGMTLTMVGLYGLVSYGVARRTREIGIRIAIGASRGRVMRMILTQGMVPALAGLAAGLAASIATGRLLARIVPVQHLYDPRSLVVVVPLLLTVTMIAAAVPARRASRIEPTIALRNE